MSKVFKFVDEISMCNLIIWCCLVFNLDKSARLNMVTIYQCSHYSRFFCFKHDFDRKTEGHRRLQENKKGPGLGMLELNLLQILLTTLQIVYSAFFCQQHCHYQVARNIVWNYSKVCSSSNGFFYIYAA